MLESASSIMLSPGHSRKRSASRKPAQIKATHSPQSTPRSGGGRAPLSCLRKDWSCLPAVALCVIWVTGDMDFRQQRWWMDHEWSGSSPLFMNVKSWQFVGFRQVPNLSSACGWSAP